MGPEIVEQTVKAVEKIRERIKTAQDRQKSYANKRRKELQFEIGEKVFLKVAPMKGVVMFGKKWKLRPRFIGPFEILERVGNVAYMLALLPELAAVHNVFHISMLRKYVHDPDHIVSYASLDINKDMTYEETPAVILERKVHTLRNKDIPLVKVQWNRCGREEATWEREDEILARYPDIFKSGKFNFEYEIYLSGEGCSDPNF